MVGGQPDKWRQLFQGLCVQIEVHVQLLQGEEGLQGVHSVWNPEAMDVEQGQGGSKAADLVGARTPVQLISTQTHGLQM